MTDVLDLARKRREELIEEVSALDEFVRIGEALINRGRADRLRSAAASLKAQTDRGIVVAPPDQDAEDLARRLSRSVAAG